LFAANLFFGLSEKRPAQQRSSCDEACSFCGSRPYRVEKYDETAAWGRRCKMLSWSRAACRECSRVCWMVSCKLFSSWWPFVALVERRMLLVSYVTSHSSKKEMMKRRMNRKCSSFLLIRCMELCAAEMRAASAWGGNK